MKSKGYFYKWQINRLQDKEISNEYQDELGFLSVICFKL